MSLLSIGMSGLNAAQGSLSVLSNNIANVNTPGYSRQQTTQNTNASNPFGGVYIGSGTTLADVRRVYNEYLDTAYQNSTALNNDAKAYLDQVGAVDKVLSDKTTVCPQCSVRSSPPCKPPRPTPATCRPANCW